MPGTIADRIVVLKAELGVSSNRELEKGGHPGRQWLISNGLLATWETKDPSDFTSNKVEKFLNHYKINRTWWKTGNGDVFVKNGTSVPEQPAINKNLPFSEEREILIRNLERFGKTNEYLLDELKRYKDKFGHL